MDTALSTPESDTMTKALRALSNRSWISLFILLLYVLAVTVGAFSGGFWASLGIGGALTLFLATGYYDKRLPEPQRNITVFIFGLLIVCAFLNLYSTQMKVSWLLLLKLVTILVPLSLYSCPQILPRAMSPKLFIILPWAAVVGVLALSLELALKGPLQMVLQGHIRLTEYNRGLSYIVVLTLPIIAGLWTLGRRWVILPFVLALLVATDLTDSRAAKLALLLALATMVVATYLPLFTRRLLALLPITFVLWPFVVREIFLNHRSWIERLPDSWQARMEIWDYMSYRILERPWLGWGLGSSRFLSFQVPHGSSYHFVTMPASHPHNAIIQLWVELGLPGVALGIFFILWVLQLAVRLGPKMAPFALGTWTAGLCLSLVSYDLWTDSLLSAFALAAFLLMILQNHMSRSDAVRIV